MEVFRVSDFELRDAATGEPDYIYPRDNLSYCGDDAGSLQSFRATFEGLFYSCLLLLGVLGNGLMVTVLLSRWRLLRVSEVYLLHLAVSDLLLLATFPFSILENATGWIFGEFLCKLVGLARQLNLLCGSFLLACISVDRYLAIVHAVASLQRQRRRTVHLTCTALWMVCLAYIGAQSGVPHRDGGRQLLPPLCSFDDYGIHANNWAMTMRVLEHVCFFLPLAIMGSCYAAVVGTLLKSARGQTQLGAIKLALLITLVFCVCWLPYNVASVLQTRDNLSTDPSRSCESVLLLQAALVVTKSLGFSHCCLNPFLYAFVGVRFRRELLRLLSKAGCGRVCPPLSGVQNGTSCSEATSTSTVRHRLYQ
ncbi:hypothetical protein fugu_010517 [Takifugu bimaculatus]|uniref:G-protein coupled receptors family 1 profile domain-containing protein n=1 Tax=Takifugu bimaculatus TaxID=433685 RepID=A0A4Z2CA86_9TELE|nr:hypothetical protein fugu_010517 [Takifugu bimaculatus]